MKRIMITIDECMSMSKEQINQFLDKDEILLREGLIDKNQPNIDFMGMTDEQIADKYGFTPAQDVYDKIMEKLTNS